MGQVLHGCATTTEAIRRAIKNSQESLRALARRYGVNQKTIAKWKKRETVADLRQARSGCSQSEAPLPGYDARLQSPTAAADDRPF